MSRRAAVVTQADVARSVRAAKQAGAAGVEVLPDGRIFILFEAPAYYRPNAPVAPKREIVL